MDMKNLISFALELPTKNIIGNNICILQWYHPCHYPRPLVSVTTTEISSLEEASTSRSNVRYVLMTGNILVIIAM